MYNTFISTEELAQNLDNLGWLVVDCRFALDDTGRGRKNYQDSHIPHAIYAHLDEDLSGPIIPNKTGRHPLPDSDTFSQKLSQWGIDEEVQVVAYDDGPGAMGARLWWMLHWMGHERVAVLDGGWKRWQQENHPTTDVIESRALRSFTPRLRPELLSSAEEVLEVMNNPDYRLIDARSSDRFRGENETIDPVGGHIPHALSFPFTGNIGPNGLILSKEELRARFDALAANVESEKIISYCGSGVTACHNLLAMMHAGLGDGKLYAGSWSDWITDPNRPIER